MGTIDTSERMPLHRAVYHALRTVRLRNNGVETMTPYIVSSPGAGKTKLIIDEITKMKDFAIMACTPGLQRLEEFGGIPDIFKVSVIIDGNTIEELHTKWSVPEIISKARDLANSHKFVVVLLDDWHICGPEIQCIGFELFTHHSLSGHKIPNNVSFILAGNETSTAGAQEQLSAIVNRCIVIKSLADFNYWVKNFALPNKLHPLGISFLQHSIYNHFFMEDERDSPYGSPRSWTTLFNHLTDIELNEPKINMSELLCIFSGCVGPTAAQDFLNYYMISSKINAKEIFKTGSWKLPMEDLSKYVFIHSVVIEYYNLFCKCSEDKNKALFKNYSNIFSDIIKYLFENESAIFLAGFNFLVSFPEDKKYNVKSGMKLVSDLCSNKYLPKEVFEKYLPMVGSDKV